MTMRRSGRLLILAGVLVWAIYAVVWLAGGEPEARYFLPFHLSGVVTGSILARWRQRGVAED